MKRMAFALCLLVSPNCQADPMAHKNIELFQYNQGNSNATSTIEQITGSFVQVSAAGNALNIKGNLESSNIVQQNYGNDFVDAIISNISGSLVQVSAIGNSVTIE